MNVSTQQFNFSQPDYVRCGNDDRCRGVCGVPKDGFSSARGMVERRTENPGAAALRGPDGA